MDSTHYDGLDSTALARRLHLPNVAVWAQTASTMDEAHALAARGAPAGTLVLAHEQTSGRGRSGARWLARKDASILCTIVERPDPSALDVLSLRAALAVSAALDRIAREDVGVKWPNDILLRAGKLAGILIETRWRSGRPDWVAVAIGLNMVAPDGVAGACGLPAGTSRLDVLDAIVPALRGAARATGRLSTSELAEWAHRDRLAGRTARAPVAGVIRGILPTGELIIDMPSGPAAVRSGSVTLEDT